MAMTLATVSFKDSSSWYTLLNLIYPIGSLYFSYTSTSPATRFGGTWSAITGRFIYANAGTGVGGANTHQLTINEMPSHRHAARGYHNVVQQYSGLASLPCVAWEDHINDGVGAYSNATGSGAVHNNMPAYQTVYCWRRTA